jgi:hypothetical protein
VIVVGCTSGDAVVVSCTSDDAIVADCTSDGTSDEVVDSGCCSSDGVIVCSSLDEVIGCSIFNVTAGWFSTDDVGISESVLGLRRIVIGCEIGSGVDIVELSLLLDCFVFFLCFDTI